MEMGIREKLGEEWRIRNLVLEVLIFRLLEEYHLEMEIKLLDRMMDRGKRSVNGV